MIEPSRNQFPTTAQSLAAANARLLLESEPRSAFDIFDYQICCMNPEASDGQKQYNVMFRTANGDNQQFDGRHWDNFPV